MNDSVSSISEPLGTPSRDNSETIVINEDTICVGSSIMVEAFGKKGEVARTVGIVTRIDKETNHVYLSNSITCTSSNDFRWRPTYLYTQDSRNSVVREPISFVKRLVNVDELESLIDCNREHDIDLKLVNVQLP